jgi:hypothetical protein
MVIALDTVRASTFSRTELFRVPYRTVLLANRIIFGKTSFFLAYRYSTVRYGTLKIRFVKRSMRVLYIHHSGLLGGLNQHQSYQSLQYYTTVLDDPDRSIICDHIDQMTSLKKSQCICMVNLG